MNARQFCLVAVAAVASCTFDTRVGGSLDASADVAIEDSADARAAVGHLLLSEVKTSNDARLREFIEIFNPTDEPVELRDYYLADTATYARLPAIAAGETALVEDNDFVVRFPSGAVIDAAAVVVVALRSSEANPFSAATFAVSPEDATPTMDEAFPASIGAMPELDNDDGEGIVLFRWDGQSDLVTDIDLLNAGYNIGPTNMLADKTNVAIDGPDADVIATSYADDAYTMPSPLRSNGVNEAFVRVLGEVSEIESDGNGNAGHDETSENIRESWSFASETPGTTELSF